MHRMRHAIRDNAIFDLFARTVSARAASMTLFNDTALGELGVQF